MNSIGDFATYIFRPSTTQEIPWRNNGLLMHVNNLIMNDPDTVTSKVTSKQTVFCSTQVCQRHSGKFEKRYTLGLVYDEPPAAYVYKRLRCLWTESWESFVFVKEKRKKSNISCCKSIPRKTSLSRRPCNKWCCVNPSSQTILLWSLIIISILSEIRCLLDIYRKPVSSLAIVQYRTKRRQTIISDLFSVYIQ